MKHYRQGLCLLLIVLITHLESTRAHNSKATQGSNKHARPKRQTGDIVLMGYKAQKALKGTTRSSDFFHRIGKEWVGYPGSTDNDMLAPPSGFSDGLYEDSNGLEEENW